MALRVFMVYFGKQINGTHHFILLGRRILIPPQKFADTIAQVWYALRYFTREHGGKNHRSRNTGSKQRPKNRLHPPRDGPGHTVISMY